MTAEIAILNKHAVALAADSAVTVQTPDRLKIFVSADKIFMLSKYYPVGVMIYGTGSFMGVPWETIIKSYRRKLGDQSFPHLEDYANHLLEHLRTEPTLSSRAQEEQYLLARTYARIIEIVQQMRDAADAEITLNGKITTSDTARICRHTIQRLYREECRPAADVEVQGYLDYIQREYSAQVLDWIQEVTERLPISKTMFARLQAVVIRHLATNPPDGDGLSGLVIAGFGEEDTLPSLVRFSLDARLGPYLRSSEEDGFNVQFDSGGAVLAFAQGEVVHTFMEGVDPEYQAVIEADLEALVKKLPSSIIDSLPELSDVQKESYKQRFAAGARGLHDQLCQHLQDFRRLHFWEPVIDVVNFLPKEELAMMAESLVGLTSFKRRVSLEAETVGGPVDVALISRGDGFVWVKRKHYFPAELNHGFFANYYR